MWMWMRMWMQRHEVCPSRRQEDVTWLAVSHVYVPVSGEFAVDVSLLLEQGAHGGVAAQVRQQAHLDLAVVGGHQHAAGLRLEQGADVDVDPRDGLVEQGAGGCQRGKGNHRGYGTHHTRYWWLRHTHLAVGHVLEVRAAAGQSPRPHLRYHVITRGERGRDQ